MEKVETDLVADLRARAVALEKAARGSIALLGGPPLDVSIDLSNPLEPSVWIRNEVLVTLYESVIVVGRISSNMTDLEEVGRFPPSAVLDAARTAVLDTVNRAVGVQIERLLMGAQS